MKAARNTRHERVRGAKRADDIGAGQRENPAKPDSRITVLALGFLLIICTIVVYLPICGFGYLSWDDTVNIIQNEHMNRAGSPDIGYFWWHPILFVYRPLIYTVWSLTAIAARLPSPITEPGIGTVVFNPHAFHLLNMAVHCANVLLVFAILYRLLNASQRTNGITSTLWPAAAGALVFSLHPVQVDAVAWITGCNSLLFGFFALLCLWQYVLYAQAARDGEKASRRRWRYAGATLCYLLALFTYPMAVALPVMAWALDYWALRRAPKESFRALAAWVALIIPFIIVAIRARRLEEVPIHVAWWERLFIAGDSLAFYLYKIACPLALGPDYGRTPGYVQAHAWGYVTWLVPAIVGLIVWRYRKQQPLLAGAACLFVISLLPVTGLITNAFQTYSTTADHYLYIPMLGISLAVACLLNNLSRRASTDKGVIVITAAVFITFGCLSSGHVQDYRNNEAFYTHAFKVNPGSWMAYRNLGMAMTDSGRFDDAVILLRKAVSVKNPNPDAHNDLGIALGKLRRHDEAIAEVEEALRESPNTATYAIQLGIQLCQVKQYDRAIDTFRQALRLRPEDEDAGYNLGIALGLSGRPKEAVAAYNLVLQAHPNNAQAEDKLAYCLAQGGEIGQAIEHWRKAVALKPDFIQAHYNLGAALAAQGKRGDAIAEYRATLSLAPGYAPAQQALAAMGQ